LHYRRFSPKQPVDHFCWRTHKSRNARPCTEINHTSLHEWRHLVEVARPEREHLIGVLRVHLPIWWVVLMGMGAAIPCSAVEPKQVDWVGTQYVGQVECGQATIRAIVKPLLERLPPEETYPAVHDVRAL